jgi:hypothetical protein
MPRVLRIAFTLFISLIAILSSFFIQMPVDANGASTCHYCDSGTSTGMFIVGMGYISVQTFTAAFPQTVTRISLYCENPLSEAQSMTLSLLECNPAHSYTGTVLSTATVDVPHTDGLQWYSVPVPSCTIGIGKTYAIRAEGPPSIVWWGRVHTWGSWGTAGSPGKIWGYWDGGWHEDAEETLLFRVCGSLINAAPAAVNNSFSTSANTPVPVILAATDNENCDLSFSIVTAPGHGTLGAIGNNSCTGAGPYSDTATVTYTPSAGYYGSDSFTFKVNDGYVDSNLATVSITVNAPPRPRMFEDSSSSGGSNSQGWATPANTIVLTASAQPLQVIAGEPIKIMAQAANRGDQDGILNARLTINGQVEDLKEVAIAGNSGKPFEFTVIKDKPGTYVADVNGKQAYFTVVSGKEAGGNKTIAYTITGIAGALALLVGIALLMRKRHSS